MTIETARLAAKALIAKAKSKTSSEPVDDETWNWLIDLGAWVKAHGPRPGILKYSIPTASEERTWRVVEHSALSIESALETTESE